MEQNTSVRGEKSSQKSIAVNAEAETYAKLHEEQMLTYEKEVALMETVKNLHEQVAFLLCECNLKDRLLDEHTKAAQEANTAKERAEALLAMHKQELEDAVHKKTAANERLVHLNSALKNCRQQSSCLRVEQDRRVSVEKAYKKLESKYSEARKKLANLTVENARLTKSLFTKEEIIKKVSNQMSEAKENFTEHVTRLDCSERENSVLKYEYCFLEKELKKRSRYADMANRQQIEAERQKLRLLVKKRVPGQYKMKPDNYTKVVDRQMSLTIKQLCEVEEENKILKERVLRRENEIRRLNAELARINEDDNGNLGVKKRAIVSDNVDMEAKILESEKQIVSLKTKLESMKDTKGTTEDYLENLKLINYDLDNQLCAAKAQIKEALQKVCFLEMELEDRINNDHEELEATCLELQLQLNSVSCKDSVAEDHVQEEKCLHTELEITEELTDNKKLKQRSSLRDQMAAEDGLYIGNLLNSPTIKEIINAEEIKEPSRSCYNTCNTSYRVKHVLHRSLPIVILYDKGTGLLKKLLLRRRKNRNRKKLRKFSAYKI
ncbi:uncharacterized protein [Rutidosis leptorrhynchoides]|uniref:uncharacterized protein n=1 Tax=Rutidosis leptorrhynchoides TaxID=125765 RepID=UPI003A98E65B